MSRTQAANASTSSVRTAPDIDDLAEQIATLKSDISGLTEIIVQMGQSRKQQAQDKIGDAMSAARTAGAETLSETVAQARHTAEKTSDEIADFIHRRPATALGIAAGAGFLIGLFGGRR